MANFIDTEGNICGVAMCGGFRPYQAEILEPLRQPRGHIYKLRAPRDSTHVRWVTAGELLTILVPQTDVPYDVSGLEFITPQHVLLKLFGEGQYGFSDAMCRSCLVGEVLNSPSRLESIPPES